MRFLSPFGARISASRERTRPFEEPSEADAAESYDSQAYRVGLAKARAWFRVAFDAMPEHRFETIFTLEARSNLFLQGTQQHFQLSDRQVFQMIQELFQRTTQILASKNIDYARLRRALVPNTQRKERALVFNYTMIEVMAYGREVVHHVLAHLRRESTHSVLCGDWLRGEEYIFAEWLDGSPGALGSVDRDLAQARHSPYYFVYLNNLSDADTTRIDQAFRGHRGYVGSLDLTLDSPIKTYISSCLVRAFIKHGTLIISGHEDDRDPAEDYNLSLFDFNQFGLTVRSLPLTYYGVFLSYKIERQNMPQDGDRRFSLNAMTPSPKLIDDFEVVLEEPKLRYLREQKAGSLKRAGFAELDATDIAQRIREKVDASYIYYLSRATNAPTLKFNVLVETPSRSRIECALEYQPDDGLLRVLTLF
jgi:hypothetical protein